MGVKSAERASKRTLASCACRYAKTVCGCVNPALQVNWAALYPAYFPTPTSHPRHVDILDVGCGFGGMTLELARLFPDQLVLGLEIRVKVVEYVHQRIRAHRRSGRWDIIQQQQPDSGRLALGDSLAEDVQDVEGEGEGEVLTEREEAGEETAPGCAVGFDPTARSNWVKSEAQCDMECE